MLGVQYFKMGPSGKVKFKLIRDLPCASFNFRQIFDYLCHMQMCTTMLEIGFPFYLIRLVQDLHTNEQLVALLLVEFRISK